MAKAKAAIAANLAAVGTLVNAADQRARGADTAIRKAEANRLRAVRGRVGTLEIIAMRLEQLCGGVRDRLERCRAILRAHDTRVPTLPPSVRAADGRVEVPPNIPPEPTIGLADALRAREVEDRKHLRRMTSLGHHAAGATSSCERRNRSNGWSRVSA